MAEGGDTTGEKRVSLSASAARRVKELKVLENQPNAFLRLTVSGGGCSGFQYGFNFDDAAFIHVSFCDVSGLYEIPQPLRRVRLDLVVVGAHL